VGKQFVDQPNEMGEKSGRNEREAGCDEGIIAELSRWRRGRYRLHVGAVKKVARVFAVAHCVGTAGRFRRKTTRSRCVLRAPSAWNGHQG
jgi:hypothetical protein